MSTSTSPQVSPDLVFSMAREMARADGYKATDTIENAPDHPIWMGYIRQARAALAGIEACGYVLQRAGFVRAENSVPPGITPS